MKLQEYIDQLTKVVTDNPEHANLDVIYAMDDEGNDFSKIGFAPSLGQFNDDGFTQVENFDDIDEDDRVINSICIN